jgi:hypothetical protein
MAGMKFCPPDLKTLAFYRHFNHFRGGHLKVWNYFCHTKGSMGFRPTIHFAPGSALDVSNPWISAGEHIEEKWEPCKVDALFLGGLDWVDVPEDCATPVINLIQGVRHGDPDDPRHPFLSRRAIRICVCKEVEIAIMATGKVNGPVITIPAGLDFDEFPEASCERDIPLLIAGTKDPELARKLSVKLAEMKVPHICLANSLPRRDFLSLLGRASVTIFLPLAKEGFYLPALEGMAMGTLVVCPDCVGNRGFCLNEINCLRPDYNMGSIVASCRDALERMSNGSAESILSAAFHQVHQHSIEEESRLFLRVLSALFR